MISPRKMCLIALLGFFASQIGFFSLAHAQAQTAPPPAPKTAETSKAPDYSQEAFVVELLKTSYRFEKDGTGQHEQSLRVKLQSEAALERFGQLIFPYVSANENLDIDYVRVHKANGAVVSASASDVQDLTSPVSRVAPVYTDLRQKHVTVPGLRPGDVLEYHVVWRVHTPLAPNHFWLTHDFINRELIVLDEQLEVNIPGDSTVKLKTEKDFDPSIKEETGRRIYTWKHAVLKRDEDKDDKEARRRRREEYLDPKPPQVQMSTFKSWDEVGQWYAGLERERIVPNEKIRAKAQSLVQGLKTDEDKMEALYEFVAKNFRYVSLSLGQGRYQPHAAADVMANEYGDCKDKHTLFSSMLIAAGFRAYPALMSYSRKIDADVPSPAQFDHVISAIQLNGQTLWADTTAEVAPFRLLAPPLRDKKALVIPAGSPARLETTPAEPPFVSREDVEVRSEVNELGQLKGHAHFTLRGDAEMEFRILFRRTPQSDWKQMGVGLAAAVGVRGGDATEIKTSDPAALDKPFELEFDFSRDDFLDWSSKKAKLSLPMPTLSLSGVDPDKDENSKPIQMGAPLNATFRMTLKLPAKYEVVGPVPLSVNRDYADYSASYKLDRNELTAERTYHLRQHELPAARAQDFAAFVAAARSDEEQTVAVETSVAGNPTLPDTVKVDDLIEAADAAAKNDNYAAAELLLKRVLEKEPKHKTARRDLGSALFYQRKYDEAVAVLREQTKANPFDGSAYDLIGQAFWRQEKYEEAATAFRKQLEIAPLDASAHANLGETLVQWRHYKEAVPELEKAISLKAEDNQETIYVSLGQARLNLGEIDKATEAFDKAVKISPTPLIWNNIAYNLAVSNVQLDRAMQYAESAVTAVATELRNAELSRLSSEDLNNVSNLMAYWDTLGWVYFQKGDLDTAEKYLTAAWHLEQTGESGYHLGQVFEKRGKKEDAIHSYALAAVAERLVPEPGEALARLVDKSTIAARLAKAKDEIIELRTVKLDQLPKLEPGKLEAEFYVVLTPGASRVAQATDVKFVSGAEKLRPFAGALKSAHYDQIFPDGTNTKVIRRGTLTCKDGQCIFLMKIADEVTSVD